MSIAGEVNRILNSKEQIKSALLARGIDVGNNTIDKYADIINPEIVLNDITPYNLQQASYDPGSKVLSLNASTSAFAALCACDSNKPFTLSFRLTSTAIGGSWRINLCTIDSYLPNTSPDNVHRMSLNPSVYTLGISRISDAYINIPVPSMSYVYQLSYNDSVLSVYVSSDGVTFVLLSSITATLLNFAYITVKTITATACTFDNLKFYQ